MERKRGMRDRKKRKESVRKMNGAAVVLTFKFKVGSDCARECMALPWFGFQSSLLCVMLPQQDPWI